METITTKCCIVGGGPAGIMLGFLLARAGVHVTVLEKHKDFFRDFRGDTVHPSTMQLMKELGILEAFLQQPHQRIDTARVMFGGQAFEMASFKNVKVTAPFIALMPQWDFLNFLSAQARTYDCFNLLMEHEATDLIEQHGRVAGVIAQTPAGPKRIDADLVIACDGRHSTLRERSALPVKEIGVPIDVLWFRLSRRPEDFGENLLGNVNFGTLLILIPRDDYFQAGLLIRKDSFPTVQQEGLPAFRDTLARLVPFLAGRTAEIDSWDKVKLLSVQINRLRRWHEPGLLFIGDAAHAMSPVGGVGINLAVQDAVATANILAQRLKDGGNPDSLLRRVQKRRSFPTRGTQGIQRLAHKGLQWVFRQRGPMKPPVFIHVATKLPGFQRLVARIVGVGLRPEHIHTPDVHQPQRHHSALG